MSSFLFNESNNAFKMIMYGLIQSTYMQKHEISSTVITQVSELMYYPVFQNLLNFDKSVFDSGHTAVGEALPQAVS